MPCSRASYPCKAVIIKANSDHAFCSDNYFRDVALNYLLTVKSCTAICSMIKDSYKSLLM